MKKCCALLLALSMLLALAACGQSAPEAATPAPAAEAEAPAVTTEPTEIPAVTTEPTAVPEPTEVPAENAEVESAAGLVFSTTDRDGNTWDESALADYSLIMLNFWEPWCPPCVGEMPDLEKLSQAYADRGFLILGIYSTDGQEENVDAVLSDCGTSYPILHYCDAFEVFQTGYVPTTVFLNAAGETVGETYVGSRSYAAWAQIVEGLL